MKSSHVPLQESYVNGNKSCGRGIILMMMDVYIVRVRRSWEL